MDILPPERTGTRRFRPLRPVEVVDAQFVPVQERRREAQTPRGHNDNRRQQQVLRQNALSHLMGRLESGLRRLPPDLFSALVAAVVVMVFTLAGGFSFLFQNAEAVESGRALDITHVSMVPQDADGMRVLLINGILVNRGSERRTMPAIRADLVSGEVVLASTLISPPQGIIESRESRGFSARVPHPGGKLPDLRLSVAERGVSGS
jgi:hypothetical protein